MTRAEREELAELQLRFETLVSAVQVICENAGEERAAALMDAIRQPATPQERARAQLADALSERFGLRTPPKPAGTPKRRTRPGEAEVIPLRRRAR
jgi:hypothetical protein